MRRGKRRDLVVLDRAGGGDHDGRCAVVASQIATDRDPVESPYRFARAQDRPPDRLVRPRACGQEIEHKVVGGILDSGDLLHDDVFLALEFVRVELAVRQNVAEDVERHGRVASHHAGEIAGAFDAGFGVEITANILDRLGDIARASSAGAFERHVFEQM